MNRDQYMVACAEVGLIEHHKITLKKIATESAIANILNQIFRKK